MHHTRSYSANTIHFRDEEVWQLHGLITYVCLFVSSPRPWLGLTAALRRALHVLHIRRGVRPPLDTHEAHTFRHGLCKRFHRCLAKEHRCLDKGRNRNNGKGRRERLMPHVGLQAQK